MSLVSIGRKLAGRLQIYCKPFLVLRLNLLALFASSSDKNIRARERLRPLLVPSASFRALWCRILGGREKGERGRRAGPGFLATVGVIPFFDNDHPRRPRLGITRFPLPLDISYLPTLPIALRKPEFGVSANSFFFSRFLSLGGRDYWEAEEF